MRKKSKNNLQNYIFSQLRITRSFCWFVFLFIAQMSRAIIKLDEHEQVMRLLGVMIPTVVATIPIYIISVNWLITYKDDGTFVYRNIFRKSRTFKYSEVTLVSKKFCKVCYQGEKKLFVMFNSVTHRDELEKRISGKFEPSHTLQTEQSDGLEESISLEQSDEID